MENLTRRNFMKTSAAIVAGAHLGSALNAETGPRVVLIRDKNASVEGAGINEKTVQHMLDEALMALTGESTPAAAMKRFIMPGETVGIKSNAWRYLPTPRELEKAVEKRVIDAGVEPGKISIADRGVLDNPVFKNATSIINVRPLRTHYWSGIGGCIKNLIMFSPTPSIYHPDSCADLGLLLKLPEVNGRLKLNILCSITPAFHGRGPNHFDRRYVWNYNGIIIGTDAVAVDAVGLEIVKAKRQEFFGKEINFDTIPKHIQLADTRHKLGVSDISRIQLIKIGWMENSLI